jgi:hypothetical protein
LPGHPLGTGGSARPFVATRGELRTARFQRQFGGKADPRPTLWDLCRRTGTVAVAVTSSQEIGVTSIFRGYERGKMVTLSETPDVRWAFVDIPDYAHPLA